MIPIKEPESFFEAYKNYQGLEFDSDKGVILRLIGVDQREGTPKLILNSQGRPSYSLGSLYPILGSPFRLKGGVVYNFKTQLSFLSLQPKPFLVFSSLLSKLGSYNNFILCEGGGLVGFDVCVYRYTEIVKGFPIGSLFDIKGGNK